MAPHAAGESMSETSDPVGCCKSLPAEAEEERVGNFLRISVFRRERLRKARRGEALEEKAKAAASSSSHSAPSSRSRGHQRSLSDTVCGTHAVETHRTGTHAAPPTSPGKRATISPKRTTPKAKEALRKSHGHNSLPEAYVLHRPLAEGFLDVHTLKLGLQPLSVTVPLQMSS